MLEGRSWADFRSELVGAFEAHPWERDSETVRAAFELHPVATRRSAGRVLERHRAGRVRDPWRILALEVAGPAPSSSPSEAPELETIERRLRSWVAAEGRHYERVDFLEELEQRLSGVVDVDVRARLLEHWAGLHEPEPEA